MTRILLLFLLLCHWLPASAAPLKVFACEPEWGALAHELGGDKVTVYDATNALQDVHHIQARPSLIAQMRTAQLVVCTGLDMETGWLPVLLRQAGNASVNPGTAGYFAAGSFVTPLDIPSSVSRASGDVHPLGNPHIALSPYNINVVSSALSTRLAQLDPANRTHYEALYQSFYLRWQAAMSRWAQKAAPLKGMSVVVHHDAFRYLREWLGISLVATLEPVPGVEPTITHMSRILTTLQQTPARVILYAPYHNKQAALWLSERAKVPVLMLPTTVGGSDKATNLFTLFDDLIQRLLDAGSKGGTP